MESWICTSGIRACGFARPTKRPVISYLIDRLGKVPAAAAICSAGQCELEKTTTSVTAARTARTQCDS